MYRIKRSPPCCNPPPPSGFGSFENELFMASTQFCKGVRLSVSQSEIQVQIIIELTRSSECPAKTLKTSPSRQLLGIKGRMPRWRIFPCESLASSGPLNRPRPVEMYKFPTMSDRTTVKGINIKFKPSFYQEFICTRIWVNEGLTIARILFLKQSIFSSVISSIKLDRMYLK